ncbi:acyltransferase family protein [Pseudomonas nitroreducens]|uniref:acyltransferase family protein n=1 Tax=Pseudomonas nitroreducens TaxID=46680 RepID=UPI001FB5E04E|nr:acyltransferase [Pseudomonas nitroreducens]MCJ1879060.1 acyltransferase [Pseudomonas nitroreducens]MCJ1896126.1 acyltransferase [Pseudomonas nitroreducens]
MNQGKNLEIEYLRAVAICLTLMSHLPMLMPFAEGFLSKLFMIYMPWTGVDLFFCISGYIVCKSYLDYFDDHRRQGSFALAAQAFWLRRIYRLLPTAWLWVLIPLLLSLVFNQSGVFGSWFDNLRSFTAVATFSGNLANQYNALLGPQAVYWSLALEEQFYFVLPFFLLCVTGFRWRVWVLLALIAVQFVLDRNPFGTPTTSMLNSFRLDAMMWGVLLCLAGRTRLLRDFEPTFLGQSVWSRLFVALLLFYLLGAISGQMIGVPIAVGLIAIVALLLVWIASYQKGYLFCPKVLSRPMLWLGSRSYGLYVIHVCAYHLSREIWHRYATAQGVALDQAFAVALAVTALVVLFVAAELNYRFVEQPLRRKGAEISRRRLERLRSKSTESAAGEAAVDSVLPSRVS